MSRPDTSLPSRRAFLASALPPAAAPAPPDPALHWQTIETVSALVKARRLSPLELTDACLARIGKLNPVLNAFIMITADEARGQARQLTEELARRRWRGPLHGIPVALKDLIDTAGIRTTAASAHYARRVPAEDAEVVRRLRDAGAILLGKLNMDEFAYNYTAETSYFGPSRNPWNTRCSPGGSSGGSAVAVAAGLCFATLGSDTGGSIRLPASFCGVAGLKASYGRVSTRGVLPLAWSLDHVGPLCRSARDAGVVLGALSTPVSVSRMPARSLRLGVPRAVFFDDLDPAAATIVAGALRDLSGLAAGVQDVRLPSLPTPPELPTLPLTYAQVIQAEAYAFHQPLLTTRPDLYHPGTRRSIENGAAIPAAGYILARREMERLRESTAQLFSGVDLLITPSAPGPAFPLGQPGGLVFLRNSAPSNLYGLPALSIPCGFTPAGLPVGLQITGPAGREDQVLALAVAYQDSTSWHRRHPPL